MIRVVHPGSRIRMLTFSHPGSRTRIQGSKKHPIPDPGSGSATLPVTLQKAWAVNGGRGGGEYRYGTNFLEMRYIQDEVRFLGC
jgi:hypothetical protein